jgi:hypothetical protein
LDIQWSLDLELAIAISCRGSELAPVHIQKAALSIGKGRRCQAIIDSASQRHQALSRLTAAAALIISTTTMRYYQREKNQQNGEKHSFEELHRNSVNVT